MSLLLRFFVLTIAILVISKVLPGMRLKRLSTALIVAAIYSLLNVFFFKVLIFITFPLVLLKYLTLGVFGVLINAVLLRITDHILDDFELSSFATAFWASFGITIVNMLMMWLIKLF